MKALLFAILFIVSAIGGLSFAQPLTVPKFDNPVKLGDGVNSEAEETSPVIGGDGRMYFVRTFHEKNVGGRKAGQDIWVSWYQGAGLWGNAENVKWLNNRGNNAVVGLCADAKTLYLLNQYAGQNTKQGMSLTHVAGDSFTKPTALNIPELKMLGEFYGFWMSPTGDTLLISANLKGGFGEEDLYVCFKKSGAWSEPLNLGPTINTYGFEISPFLDNDGKTLYYATSGKGGSGNADIYITRRSDNTWTKWSVPKNLGKQLNSKEFDAYPWVYDGWLYFASARGGNGSDIYAAAFLYGDQQPSIINNTPGMMLPAAIKVYFKLNDHMLYAEEKRILDEVIKTLNSDNKLKATVSGYTCDIGPGEKNDKLSAMRANSVLTYLMLNGIDETRITVKHFGEVESKTENEKDKELNRRVDVIFSY